MKNIIMLLVLISFMACEKETASDPTPVADSTEISPDAAPEDSTEPTPEPTPEDSTKDPLKYVELISVEGETIKATIASTASEQIKGLQGVKDSEFEDDQAMLFFYLTDSARSFWMPNTYFNLDLIYLDENMKITNIVWNLNHYTGNVSSQIPRAPTIVSRHVLEMKAGSHISSKLKIGDRLEWKSSLTIDQTESKIRILRDELQ